MIRGKCSICGGDLRSASSVCDQCKDTSRGHYRHLNLRSYKDVIMGFAALVIFIVLIGTGCWIFELIISL